MTAALGVRIVVIEGPSDPAGAHGAPPWAIGLRAPLWHSEIGDDEGFLSETVLPKIAKAEAPAVRPTVEAAPPLSVEPRPRAGETSVCRDRGNQRLRPADHPVKIHVISVVGVRLRRTCSYGRTVS